MSSEKPIFSTEGSFLIIVVLGLMMYLLIPRFGTPSADIQTESGAHLRSIVNTYIAYSSGGKAKRTLTAIPGDTAHAAAFLLAHYCGINDTAFWFIYGDGTLANQTIPRTVTVGQPPDDKINPDFAKLTLAYEFAANVPLDAPSATTPIAWTRGLRADGTWAPDSPWQGKGGHIAYLDGHVDWVDNALSTTKQGGTYFLKYGTNTPTVNIREALPPGAVILSAEPNGPQR